MLHVLHTQTLDIELRPTSNTAALSMEREENCFEQVEQEYSWSAMLLHSFLATSEVNLTAAVHVPFHLYDLPISLILYYAYSC